MTSLAAYITENKAYLGSSLAVIESLSETQFAVLQAVTMHMGDADTGIDNSPVKSHETLADFDASRRDFWSEKGRREAAVISGHDVVIFENFQMTKGQPRRSAMAVVQFDGFTIALA